MKVGELTAEISKASGGDRKSENFKNDNGVDFDHSKKAQLKSIGIAERTAERFEHLTNSGEKSKHQAVTELGLTVYLSTALAKGFMQAKRQCCRIAHPSGRR